MPLNRLSCFYLILLIGMISSCAKPKAIFTYEGPEKPAPIATVTFENESKNAEQYEWDFGDSNTSTEAAPSHRFEESGKYTVRLKAFKGEKVSVYEQEIDVKAPKNCTVILETEFGSMTILLYDATPLHRDNFIRLAEDGYFDELLFHRVMKGFMVQGGDPKSRTAKPNQALGMGGPGYTIPAEFVDSLFHVRGALAAARQPDSVNPELASSGSQFYIVQGRQWADRDLDILEKKGGFSYPAEIRKAYKEVGGTAQLDRGYTVFGQVIDGMEVVDKIADQQTDARNRPKSDIKMKFRVVY